MKTVECAVAIINLMVMGWSQSRADISATEKKYNVAVLELVAEGELRESATILSDRFRMQLLNTGKFAVMERGQMDAVMKEQGFQATGACSEDACLVQMGQVLGVDYMVAGSLGRLGQMYMINSRMIEVQTGKIAFSKAVDCKCPVEELVGALEELAWKMAGREMAEQKGTTAASKPWRFGEGKALKQLLGILPHKEPSPATQYTGTMELITYPNGAQVIINGKEMGVTPFKVELEFGDYLIVLKKEGFRQMSIRERISRKDPAIKRKLWLKRKAFF